jgi:hypothetical protein
MTWDQLRYIGNGVITVVAVTALYLLYAHRYSERPFDYLWQGYVCPTANYMNCVEGFEPAKMSTHYVDRQFCAVETERTMSIEKVAESYPDLTIDVGFMYGCQRSDYRRSGMTPAQFEAGLIVDATEPAATEAPTPKN